MRKTVNISLSEDMLKFIQKQTAEGRFSSVSEYLRSLVRRDQKGLSYRASVSERPVQIRKANDYMEEYLATLEQPR